MKKEAMQQVFSAGNINLNSYEGQFDLKLERPKLLLHSCCGPCSTACIERLMEDYEITVFFYNPNITDKTEYDLRLDAQKTVIEKFNEKAEFMLCKLSLVEGEYRPQLFYQASLGLEDEPEGGNRCTGCFNLRLSETADYAKKHGFDFFTTTLTVSPHKNYRLISDIGKSIAEKENIAYLDMDFKKKNGFLRSIELSKEFGIYRQNYCGCEFSKWFEKEEK